MAKTLTITDKMLDTMKFDTDKLKRIKKVESKVRKLETQLSVDMSTAKETKGKLAKAQMELRAEIREETPQLPFPESGADGDDGADDQE